MSEKSEVVIRRFFLQVIGQGRIEVLDDLLRTCYIEHRQGSLFDVTAGIKTEMQAIRDAFPNRMVVVEDMAFAGDLVWCRWSLSAEHRRPFMGFPATGTVIETSGVDVFRIDKGRIAERWTHQGSLGLRRQLELVTPVAV